MILNKRTFGKQLRADGEGDKPVIAGHFNVFSTLSEPIWDYFQEEIQPGAFKNSLKGEYRDDIKALFDHDPSKVLGSRKAGTLNLKEDKTGLYGEVDPPDTSFARDLVESLKRGDIDSASFGFYYKRTMWRDAAKDSIYDVLEVHDLDLVEVSFVTFPAFAATEIGIRSFLPSELKEEEKNLICRAFNRLENRDQLSFDLEYRQVLQQYRSALYPVLPEDKQAILKREVNEGGSAIRRPEFWEEYVDSQRLGMVD